MTSEIVTYHPSKSSKVQCTVSSPEGLEMFLIGEIEDTEPKATGDKQLLNNFALLSNTWAYAKFEKLRRSSRSESKRADFKQLASGHKKTAADIAYLIDYLEERKILAWCSGCITKSEHQVVSRGLMEVQQYLCGSCGMPTTACVAPSCKHMAVQVNHLAKMPKFCAEHRHEIYGFKTSQKRLSKLEDYKKLMDFEQRNLSRVTKYAGYSAITAGLTAATFGVAVPAIGGAIGASANLSGAAATSYGLAWLGGGALAATGGGFGMAGGTLVITAAGAALGSGLGLSLSTSYLKDDKSFKIEKIRIGKGTPVLFMNGFLTETKDSWDSWEAMITRRYPEAPIYRVHWGSKQVDDLHNAVAVSGSKVVIKRSITRAASIATSTAASKLDPVFLILSAAMLAKNPWHVAKNRADKTGVVIADLLARTNEEKFILIGHSLGARVAAMASEVLSTKTNSAQIEDLHLLGAAIGGRKNWHALSKSVSGNVHNYFSKKDNVLKYLYRIAQAGSTPVGLVGFKTSYKNIKDHDVTAIVESHSEYFSKVKLI